MPKQIVILTKEEYDEIHALLHDSLIDIKTHWNNATYLDHRIEEKLSRAFNVLKKGVSSGYFPDNE